ncbi:MAG: hypothetical protein AAF721_17665 [Myxococcota bacterium]
MKIKIVLMGLSLAVSALAVGCGSSSPKAFSKRSGKIGCRSMKKCDEEAWKASGYDTVSECIDEVNKEDAIEAFVDACKDFDNGKARECLAAGRKYKRTCDDSDLDEDALKACAGVCGDLLPSQGLQLDPTDPESMHDVLARALEIAEEEYEDEDEDEDEAPLMTLAP